MDKKRLHYTIFNTPIITPFLRLVALFLMKITGWKTAGDLPDAKKFVLVVAPHTSNWDLFYGILIALAFRLDVYYMAKHQLFKFPFGRLMKWLGGIRIDRSHAGNNVAQTIQKFNENEYLIIAVPPEGTRSKAAGWKSGFYHIAHGAGVPMALAFIDYARKAAGIKRLFYPTGDIEADMAIIRETYADVTGKHDDQKNEIRIRADDRRIRIS
jgi:1-acyl-sn-glycerol-3-phosphate acyltransferase